MISRFVAVSVLLVSLMGISCLCLVPFVGWMLVPFSVLTVVILFIAILFIRRLRPKQ